MSKILVVDNFDSFVYILVDYLRQLGAQTEVERNWRVPTELDGYDGVLISPGPGAPADAGQSIETIKACAERGLPMLGVCLGMQALAEAFGAKVGHAKELRHGKTSPVTHDGTGVFQSLPSPFEATRYHSLAVRPSTLTDDLRVTAWADGEIMGLAHTSAPLQGVQFHPESVLTEGGLVMIGNWLQSTRAA
jgi:para-aminobenzoate synthetase component 2